MAWFFMAALGVSYGTYTVAGSMALANASGVYDPVIIRDEVGPNSHALSGMIMVPTACDQLSVKTNKLSHGEYELTFTTWHDPSVDCTEDATPRAFHSILFAPSAGVTFTAVLDGKSLPIVVTPHVVRVPSQ